MKKAVALLLAMVLAFAVLLCGCGNQKKPSGTYVCEKFLKLEFSGNKVTMIVDVPPVGKTTTPGTFKMDGNKIICSFSDGSEETSIYNPQLDTIDYCGLGELIYEKEK